MFTTRKCFSVLLLLISGLVFIDGCKKYPDGPALTLRTKKGRFTGRWQMESYFINGVDSTFSVNPNGAKYTIAFYADNSYRTDLLLNGNWTFTGDGKMLMRFKSNLSMAHPYGVILSDECYWMIRRLTSKDLWLEADYGPNKYYAKLKYIGEY